MKKFSLLIFIICINVLFAFLLIHKQNNKVKLLYEIQKLQKQREELLDIKKSLILQMHKDQQLSTIQTFAQKELAMNSITVNDVKTISLHKE